jgi:hypothetical protein
MIASALAALALAAAPDAAHAHGDHAGHAPAAQAAPAAKPRTKRVCQTVTTSSARTPRKVCTTVKVDDAPASAPEPAQAQVARPE